MKKIIVKKLKTCYLVSDKDGYTISVEVKEDGTLNIFRQAYFNRGFDFRGSSKEVVKAIANLLLTSLKLE